MTPWLSILLVVPALSLMADSPTPQPALEWYPQNYSKLDKITAAPLKMNPIVATACASAISSASSGTPEKFFDVYISSSGAPIIKSGTGIYPEGTVILKRKYSDADGTVVELYTGMVKRAAGSNPRSGDWEYFTAAADGKITGHGALESCMSCHRDYANSDYVTRAYLTQAWSYSATENSRAPQLQLQLKPPAATAPNP